MLASALRAGTGAVRRGGWRGALIALAAAMVTVAASAITLDWAAALVYPVAVFLQQVASFALIRYLATRRYVIPTGIDEGDRVLGVVTRRAAGLSWPALRLTGVFILVELVTVLLVFLLAFGSGIDLGEITDDKQTSTTIAVGVAIQVVAALLGAFFAVAEQRIAIERDPRVLLACAHSLRVARQHFGPVFGLTLIASAVGIGEPVLAGISPPLGVQLIGGIITAGCVLVATAGLTHVYLMTPVDLPPVPR